MKLIAADAVTEVETLDGRRVRVRLRVNPRARRISLRINVAEREAIAVAPTPRHAQAALAFAAERAHWIAQQLARVPEGVSFAPGVTIPIRGAAHELVSAPGRGLARLLVDPARLVAPTPAGASFAARVTRFLAAEAKRDLTARVDAHCATLGVRYSRLTVKDTTSRWGSCTSDGALAFSWRVILAPPMVLDYLAAHEVAHLVEMNHSRRFWAQVRKALPDYACGRAWLAEHGAGLHRFGAP
jgi:predicted metal-dependent hydrolase